MFGRLVLLAIVACCHADFYNYVYMINRCGETHTVTYADHVYYAISGYEKQRECVLTLDAAIGGVILNIMDIDAATNSYIDIYDGPTTDDVRLTSLSLTQADGGTVHSYRSSGSSLTIRFVSYDSWSGGNGFHGVVTEVDQEFCDIEYQCCDQGCISSDLRYDGVRNCADDSDEWDTSGCLTLGELLGVIFGSVGFLIVVLVIIACCVRRRRPRPAYSPMARQTHIHVPYPNYNSTAVVQPATVYSYSGHLPGAVKPPPYPGEIPGVHNATQPTSE